MKHHRGQEHLKKLAVELPERLWGGVERVSNPEGAKKVETKWVRLTQR